MATVFPSSLDTFTTKVNGVDDVLAADTNNLQDAVAALQVKVGVNGSSNTNSLDYKASDTALRAWLNATGSAPLYAARAWVNFNGTGTVAIRAAGNVSSITDNGTGDYTVNFTTALPDANYALCGSVEGVTNHPARALAISQNAVPTVSAVRIHTGLTGASTVAGRFEDCAYVSVAIFR